MRDLKRGRQRIFYSLRNVSSTTDEWGNTEDVKTYGTPIPFDISVSGNKGEAASQAFGTELAYDREIQQVRPLVRNWRMIAKCPLII